MIAISSHPCPVCSYPETHNISYPFTGSVTSDFRYLDFSASYHHCEECGYIYREMDKRIDHSKYYTHTYQLMLDAEDTEKMMFEENETKYSDYLISFMEEFITNKKNKKLLDIGAGKGNFVISFHNKFPEVEISALEPSKSYQLLNKNKFLIHCHNTFFSAKYFPDIHFDYINLSEVLEHVLKPKDFLEAIKSIMGVDSFLLVSVPNIENDKYDFLSPDHVSRFTPASIENLFRISGLKILKSSIPKHSASMLFLTQITSQRNIKSSNSQDAIKSAIGLIENAIRDAEKIKNQKIAIYGQGLITYYLLGEKIFTIDNISCIIDDNKTFQGKKWKERINIISLDTFLQNFRTKNLFLAMNECYHQQVIEKLPKIYNFYGIRRV